MTTEEASARPEPRSDRRFSIGFVLVAAIAMAGWLYAITRAIIAVVGWFFS
jgi:hypothetical protein